MSRSRFSSFRDEIDGQDDDRLFRWQRLSGLAIALLVLSHAAEVIAEDRNASSVILDDILPVLQIVVSFVVAGLMFYVFSQRSGNRGDPDEYEQFLNTRRTADAFMTSIFGILVLTMVTLFVELPGFAVALVVIAIMNLALVAPVVHVGRARPSS